MDTITNASIAIYFFIRVPFCGAFCKAFPFCPIGSGVSTPKRGARSAMCIRGDEAPTVDAFYIGYKIRVCVASLLVSTRGILGRRDKQTYSYFASLQFFMAHALFAVFLFLC